MPFLTQAASLLSVPMGRVTDELEDLWVDLRRHGLRRTGPRVAVLRVLAAEDLHHLTASEIHERLQAMGDSIDLTTVYRSVTTLEELGVVHATARADHSTAYGLAVRGHHHVVCTNCGAIAAITSGPFARALAAVHDETGFHVDQASVTIQGLCPRCAALSPS